MIILFRKIIKIKCFQETDKISTSTNSSLSNKKKKKPFLLPWWCVYVSWILVFITVSLAGFFTLLYSFEWGKEKSSEWLTAFLLSFFQSALIIQPFKVIILAVVLSAIFKKPKDEEEDNVNDLEEDEILNISPKNPNQRYAVSSR